MTKKEIVPAPGSSLWEFDPFRDFFRSPVGISRLLEGPLMERAETVRWAPAMDVAESKDGYTVTAEIPGVSKDDISVECHDNVITIKGEKRDEREETDEHRHYVERSYGSFSRSFRLPPDASDDIQASFRNGVLTVVVPKQEEKKPRTVTIKAS
jgi:HSP20 family protein